MENKMRSSDRLRRWVHRVLLIGVLISALLFVAGLARALATNEARPQQPELSIATVIRAAGSGSGVALLNLGILALMLTPISRVFVLAVGWAIDRQYRMALIALCVLILLGISVVISTG